MSKKEGYPSNCLTRQESPSKVLPLRRVDRKPQLDQLKRRFEEEKETPEKILQTVKKRVFRDSIPLDFSPVLKENIFSSKARELKICLKELQEAIDYLNQSKFRKYRDFGRDQYFPLKWMADDKVVSAVMEKRPILCDYLNYLHNMDRWDRGSVHQYIVEKTGEFLKGEKYGDRGWEPSAFIADRKHYRRAVEKLGYSENYLRQLNSLLARYHIIEERTGTGNGRGRKVPVFIMGYFVKANGKLVKKTLLTRERLEDLRLVCQNLSLI